MLSVGDIVRVCREMRRMSQEELCDGVCAPGTLSRIENGGQIPNRKTFEALMLKMGLPPDMYPSFVDANHLKAYQLWYEIRESMEREDFDEAEAMLKQIEKIPKANKVYRQDIMFSRAILFRNAGASGEEMLEKMKEVMGMRDDEIDPLNFFNRALSMDDLNILNSLAVSYYNVGECDLGIEILYGVKGYIEKRIVYYTAISPTYTMVLCNLSRWVGRAGQHQEAKNLAEIGIKDCLKYGRTTNMPKLRYIRGCALAEMGLKDEARAELQLSYWCALGINRPKVAAGAKKASERFGIPFL
ncbi:MAG: helix-turn-helix transcriptional regulator [Defluviitaleaceae bacterium]|nr:helix-turn-helix transcriptional regulator [Defluviitaleaceae bacterium]